MSPEKIKLGLVGAGAIAQSYLKALEDLPVAEITAIADTRQESAKAAAELAGCKAFTNVDDMLQSGLCQAVILCTPPATHVEIGLKVIAEGLHLLCEKPLSTSLSEARRLKEAAEEKGVVMTMASKFRYVDDMIRAKAIITSGILGRLLRIENAFTSRIDMSQRWNADRKLSGGGVLIDNGTHSVDIIRYLSGPITRVFAVEGPRLQSRDVEDSVDLFAITECGCSAHVDLTWSVAKDKETFIDIYGSDGAVQVGWRQSRYRQVSGRDWIVFGQGYDKVQAFRRKLENFCNALLGREQLLITSEDALASVEVIQRAYESLQSGEWADLSGPGAATKLRVTA